MNIRVPLIFICLILSIGCRKNTTAPAPAPAPEAQASPAAQLDHSQGGETPVALTKHFKGSIGTSLDLQILRTVSLIGKFKNYRVELGLKVFNLTNQFNPRDFQNNLASDDFGGFYNGVGRKFGTRITFVKK